MPGGLFDYGLFEKELKIGHYWQEVCADIIRKLGHTVESSEYKIVADSSPEIAKFSNSTDLIVDGYVVETKSTHYEFTRESGFPFYRVFIDTVQGWDKKAPEPIGVVRISQKTRAIFYISTSRTKHLWKTYSAWDSTRRLWDVFYWCPKNKIECIEALSRDIRNLGVVQRTRALVS